MNLQGKEHLNCSNEDKKESDSWLKKKQEKKSLWKNLITNGKLTLVLKCKRKRILKCKFTSDKIKTKRREFKFKKHLQLVFKNEILLRLSLIFRKRNSNKRLLNKSWLYEIHDFSILMRVCSNKIRVILINSSQHWNQFKQILMKSENLSKKRNKWLTTWQGLTELLTRKLKIWWEFSNNLNSKHLSQQSRNEMTSLKKSMKNLF